MKYTPWASREQEFRNPASDHSSTGSADFNRINNKFHCKVTFHCKGGKIFMQEQQIRCILSGCSHKFNKPKKAISTLLYKKMLDSARIKLNQTKQSLKYFLSATNLSFTSHK